MKLKELAEKVQGTIYGDPETEITGVAGVGEAGAGDITFIASPKFTRRLQESRAACVILKEPVPGILPAQLQVANPYFAFAKAVEIFYPRPSIAAGVSGMAFISDTAKIDEGATILPFAFISEDAEIGDGAVISPGAFVGAGAIVGRGTFIGPNVTIREGVRIGQRVLIHAGTVIGSDGFGYVLEKGAHYKIPQVGGVVIGDDVEIGSNVSIDRATLGNTVIGRGTKIDNLVQIGHNVKIGEHAIIVAHVAIGGSSDVGSYVILGGQAGVADHSTIEAGAMIGAQSGLAGRVEKGVYSGSPAIPHKLWLRAQSLYAKLPDMHRKIKELEERITLLEKGEKDA